MTKPIKYIDSFNKYVGKLSHLKKDLQNYELRDGEDNNAFVLINQYIKSISVGNYLNEKTILDNYQERVDFLKELSELTNPYHVNKNNQLSILVNELPSINYLNDIDFNFLYENSQKEYPFVDHFIKNFNIKYKTNMLINNEQNYNNDFLFLIKNVKKDDNIFQEKYLPQLNNIFNSHYKNNEIKEKLFELGYKTNIEDSPYGYVSQKEEVDFLLKNNIDINTLNSNGENILFKLMTNIYTLDESKILPYVLEKMDENIINKLNKNGYSFLKNIAKNSYLSNFIFQELLKSPKVKLETITKDVLNCLDFNIYKPLILNGDLEINDDNFNQIKKLSGQSDNYLSSNLYNIFQEEKLYELLHKKAPIKFSQYLNEYFLKDETFFKDKDIKNFKKLYEYSSLPEKDKIEKMNKLLFEKMADNTTPQIANLIGKLNHQYDGGATFMKDFLSREEAILGEKPILLNNILKHISIDVIKDTIENKKNYVSDFLDRIFHPKYISNRVATTIIKKDLPYFKKLFNEDSNLYEKYILKQLYNQPNTEKYTFRLLLDAKNPFELLSINSLKVDNSLCNEQSYYISTIKNLYDDYTKQNNISPIPIDTLSTFTYIKELDKDKVNDVNLGLTMCDFMVLVAQCQYNTLKNSNTRVYPIFNEAFNELIEKGYKFTKTEMEHLKEIEFLTDKNKFKVERNIILDTLPPTKVKEEEQKKVTIKKNRI